MLQQPPNHNSTAASIGRRIAADELVRDRRRRHVVEIDRDEPIDELRSR